ncbi:hypothetical protein [Aeromonas sp. MrichA-1]|uniref:hypothetical protein n=1 Tax=Aeromonas sp. MrichA-1 TaxID=2823362 RepID=UPI001B32D1CC|nr:hypothetical protein [Aeromonas sp. MrichA-1]MBP4081650.1 hypothetical protein [Aeromonas sp. MrichA-1]
MTSNIVEQQPQAEANHVFVTSMAALKKFKPEEVKKNDLWLVSPHLIEIEPGFNARKDYTTKKKLKHIASLRRQWNTDPTQIPPIRVRIKDGHLYVGDGHCRMISLRQAIEEDGLEFKFVQCIPFQGNDVAQLMLILTSQDGLPLDYVEQADVFTRLTALGLTDEDLAAKRNCSVQHIRNIRSIASLPYRLQGYITSEVIPYSNALEVVRKYGETKAMELIDGIIEQKKKDFERLLNETAEVAQPNEAALSDTETETDVETEVEVKKTAPEIRISRKELDKAMDKPVVRFTKKVKESTVNVVSQLAELLVDTDEAQTVTLTPELVAELKKLKEGFSAKQESVEPVEPVEGDSEEENDGE